MFFITEFERAAKIRKNAVYHFLVSLRGQNYNGLKKSSFRAKGGKKAAEVNQKQ